MKCNCELHVAPHCVHVSRLTPGASRIRRMASPDPASPPAGDPLPVSPDSAELPEGGTIRPVTRWGTEVMHRRARPVTSYDDELRSLVADMVATMYAADGVGLAACQIGVDLAVFVFDCPDDSGDHPPWRGVQPDPRAARGQGTAARRLGGGVPVLPGRVRGVRAARPRPRGRHRPGGGRRRLRGRRPAGALPAARGRPHRRHGLR